MRCFALLAASSTWIASSIAIQPGAAPAQPAPLRELEFGDINFLHTTDTHGWHAGHLLESSYSADWGDYVSFSHHLRKRAEAEGRDLLVIDTGDRVEGNGLYDASSPRGEYTFGIFKQQHVDLLCSGNHELYKNSSIEDDFFKLVPAYGNHYLASNLLIRNPQTHQLQPLSATHRKFTTKNGLRIMSFGFIFDFDRNDLNSIVIPVEEAVTYPWFQDAIREKDIDLFVVIGHVALWQKEFEFVHDAIRGVQSETPIQFFGGHYHIRDYRIFDERSHALASGRFMETIGFQSISNVKSNINNITFSRRYIDNNLYSLYHHSNTTKSTFDTPVGQKTSRQIFRARKALKLDEVYGCVPQTYWMSRSPYPASNNVYSFVVDDVFPSVINPERANKTRMIMTNTGAIRFDIFAGPFTRDSNFIISPFTSNMSFIADVPYGLAKKLLPILNAGDQIASRFVQTTSNKAISLDLEYLLSPEQRACKTAQRSQMQLQESMEAADINDESRTIHRQEQTQIQMTHDRLPLPLTPGYTTVDDLGTEGDDTVHTPIPDFEIPRCVQALVPGPNSSIQPTHRFSDSKQLSEKDIDNDNESIDLIFNQFMTPYILYLLSLLSYSDSDINLHIHNMFKPNSREAQPYPQSAQGTVSTHGSWTKIQNESQRHKGEYEQGSSTTKSSRRSYTEADVTNYIPGETFTSLIAKWVSENWAGNCKGSDGYQMLSKGSADGEL